MRCFLSSHLSSKKIHYQKFLSGTKTCSGLCYSPSSPYTLILIWCFHTTHSPNALNFIQRIPKQVLVKEITVSSPDLRILLTLLGIFSY